MRSGRFFRFSFSLSATILGSLILFPACATLETGLSNVTDMVLPQTATFTVDAPAAYQDNWNVNSIGVKPFNVTSGSHRNESTQLKSMIESDIAKEGYLRVIEGGGDAIVTGNLNIGRVQTNSYTKSYKSKKKGTVYTYYYSKKLPVTGNYSLVDRRSNRVIIGDSFSFSFDQEWSSGQNSDEARANAPSDEMIVHGILQQIAQKVVWTVSPHKETVTRKLEKGSDSSIRLGNRYLENNSPDQAILIWQEVLNKTEKPKDKAAVLYNMGVVWEARGEYEKAKTAFEEANLLWPEREIYIQARERVRRSENRDKRLGEQLRQLRRQ